MFAAMASVALASCVKNEPVATVEQGDLITFASPVVAPVTKAALEFTHPEFFVYAYYTAEDVDYNGVGTLYLNKREFNAYEEEGVCQYWKASPAAYWPKNGDLTFCAYAPDYTGLTVDAEKNGPSKLVLDYTVDVENMKDVLYSTWLCDKKLANQNTDEPNAFNKTGIDLPFHHALSKVAFKVQAGSAAAASNIKIKGITLSGVKKTGELTVTWQNGVTWTSETPQQYTILASAANYANATAITTGGAQIGIDYMLIPQELSASDNLVVTYYLTTDGDPIEQTAEITLADTWANGTSYTYTIVFNLDEIKLAPVVAEDWATGAAASVPQI